MTLDAPVRRLQLQTIVLAGLLAVGLLLVLSGVSIVPLVAAATAPWFVVIAQRRGVLLALPVVSGATLVMILCLLIVTTPSGLPLLASIVVVAMVAGSAGVASVARSARNSGLRDFVCWLPATLGAIVWGAVMAASLLLPGAARYSWALLGDSANNLLFARETLYRGGLDVGSDANPVPLPSALLALAMAPGRDGLGAGEVTRHDIAAFTEAWATLIIVTSIVIGMVAAAVVRSAGAGGWYRAVIAGGASLLPLTWFFTGYPIDFGFFNAHVAIPLVLMSFLAFIGSDRSAVTSLGAQFLLATLLLAVWSPLVLTPVILGLMTIVKHRRALVACRGIPAVLLVVSIVQFVAYGLGMVLPTLLEQSGFLAAAGGAFPFRRWMLVSLALVAVLLALFVAKGVRSAVAQGVLGVSVAALAGLGALLYIASSGGNPWSYYPLKFSWLMACVLIVLVVSGAAAVLSRIVRKTLVRAVGVALIAASTLAYLGWSSTVASYEWRDPAPRILSGDVIGTGDDVAESILRYARLDQAHLLWGTEDPQEGFIDFWILQLWSDSMTENRELRLAAYGGFDTEADASGERLCELIGLLGGDVIVHTADPGLSAQIEDECKEFSGSVSVELSTS